MANLPPILQNIAKAASHPNALVHKIQLERARRKYLGGERGVLGDGKSKAMVLGTPEGEVQLENETEVKANRVKRDDGGSHRGGVAQDGGAEGRREVLEGGKARVEGAGSSISNSEGVKSKD